MGRRRSRIQKTTALRRPHCTQWSSCGAQMHAYLAYNDRACLMEVNRCYHAGPISPLMQSPTQPPLKCGFVIPQLAGTGTYPRKILGHSFSFFHIITMPSTVPQSHAEHHIHSPSTTMRAAERVQTLSTHLSSAPRHIRLRDLPRPTSAEQTRLGVTVVLN